LINFIARHLACCFNRRVGPVKVFLDSLLNLLFQGCLQVKSSEGRKELAMQTLDFLFLQLQLSLHIRERGFYLLKVFCSFGVRGIQAFVLPLFFSVKVLQAKD
jgi:hypothetical protein